MKKYVDIVVDGQTLTVDQNMSLLNALREQKIMIPSLCFHQALEGGGSCGLCVIEVKTELTWHSVHACMTKPIEHLQVRTFSAKLEKQRSWVAKLLLERGPFQNQEVIALLTALADAVVTAGNYNTNGCILCGRCIKICQKIGRNKLAFLGRGNKLKVGMILSDKDSDSCGECKACVNICPTNAIKSEESLRFTASLYK